jgi:peroxiredoxin
MRYFIFLICISGSLFGQSKDFKLDMHIKGMPDGSYLYISHKYDDKFFTDSALVKGEKAVFKGKTPESNMYWITRRKNENPTLIFFIDGGKVEVNGHADSLAKAVVKAGPTQEDYKTSAELAAKYMAQRNAFIQRHTYYMQSGNMDGAKRIVDSAQAGEQEYVKNLENFIKQHPNSNVGGYIIYSVQFDWPQIPGYDAMYAALSDKVKKGKFGKLALDKINSIKGTTVGYPALDFTQPDVNGKNVSLSSYKGKYVLVDFWASWCGPCRRENPNVVAAYQKYKNKGFDILGVSFDDNKDKWLAAIQKDNLTWTHVSDLKGWANAVGKMYNVSSIPFNLLLDKEGKIIGKGLRGAELDARLAEILGEQ